MPLSLPLDSARWDPTSARGHVESWFLKANDPRAPGRALWVKTTLLVPPGGVGGLAETWVIVFGPDGHRASKGSWPIETAKLSRDGLGAEVGPCRLLPGAAVGELPGVTWDLRFGYRPDDPMLLFPAPWMYEGGFPKSKLYSSTPRTEVSGSLTVDGERLVVDGWIGMLGHNWGQAHSPAYHWAQACLLPDGAVFEGFSGRIPLGPALSPWLSAGVLRWSGRELRFNHLGGLLGNQVEIGPQRWSCVLQERGWRLRWETRARPQDFVGLRYIDPNGRENHCLNTKIADCELRLFRREGGRWLEKLTLSATGSCAYEILTRRHDHGIPVLA